MRACLDKLKWVYCTTSKINRMSKTIYLYMKNNIKLRADESEYEIPGTGSRWFNIYLRDI